MDYTYDIYHGQQKINGQLCRVDWKLVQALRMIYETLEALHPPVRDDFLEKIKKAIDDADLVSSKVADIRPPGCEPERREDEEGGSSTYTSSAGAGQGSTP